MRQSEYSNLEYVLTFFYKEQLELANSLLMKNNLTKVASFVETYQKDAIDSLADHYAIKNGHFLILDNKGKIIYGQGPYGDQSIVEDSYQPLLADIAGSTASMTRGHIEIEGIHDIFVGKKFTPWGWTIFLTKRDTEIHHALHSILFAAFCFATLCAFICYFLIAFFFEKFLSRPINVLTDAAKAISQRSSVEAIPVFTNDELGILARSMETMSRDISEYQKYQHFWQEKLETQVKDRTEDLQRELTARSRIQNALQKNEELLNDVGLVALIGGWEIDLDSGKTVWTKQTFEILKCNELEMPLTPSQFTDLFCVQYRSEITSALESHKEKDQYYNIEAELSGEEKHRKWCRLVFRSVHERDGCVKIRGTIQDITDWQEMQQEQGRLQSKLLQAQKLEAVGRLAAGIAHEINTPTQFVGSNVDFLKGSFSNIELIMRDVLALSLNEEETTHLRAQVELLQNKIVDADWEFLSSEIPGAIKQSQEGLKRVATIVQAMKEFSHPGSKEKSEIDLNFIINNTITVARNEWKYVADINLNLEPNLPVVHCHADEIGQAILNLIVNAAHTIAEKFGKTPERKSGVISVSTTADSKWIILRIGDNGVGIPREIENKIFDPFFTTKEVGKGSGQGLAIVYDVVVNKHGGEIDVKSQPPNGTTFTIRLPSCGL